MRHFRRTPSYESCANHSFSRADIRMDFNTLVGIIVSREVLPGVWGVYRGVRPPPFFMTRGVPAQIQPGQRKSRGRPAAERINLMQILCAIG